MLAGHSMCLCLPQMQKQKLCKLQCAADARTKHCNNVLQAELKRQCVAIGLTQAKKNKEELANQLLASMQAGVAEPEPLDEELADLVNLTKVHPLTAPSKVSACTLCW